MTLRELEGEKAKLRGYKVFGRNYIRHRTERKGEKQKMVIMIYKSDYYCIIYYISMVITIIFTNFAQKTKAIAISEWNNVHFA